MPRPQRIENMFVARQGIRFLKARFLCYSIVANAFSAMSHAQKPGPNRRDLILYTVLFTLAGGLLQDKHAWLGLTVEYWAMVAVRVFHFEAFHFLEGPRLAVEMDSFAHSATCIGWGMVYLCLAGTQPLPFVEHMLKTYSYVYFLHDLARNFALYFNWGFSIMFAVHHILSIALLGLSLSFDLDWICSTMIILEWTNILRAREQIFLMTHNYSVAARNNMFRRRLKRVFEISFIVTRVIVTPCYTVMWVCHNAEKLPFPFLPLAILLSILINIGGGVWSYQVLRKLTRKKQE